MFLISYATRHYKVLAESIICGKDSSVHTSKVRKPKSYTTFICRNHYKLNKDEIYVKTFYLNVVQPPTVTKNINQNIG